MNPSIQCIFERTLAGVVVVAISMSVILGACYLVERLQKRAPEPNPWWDKVGKRCAAVVMVLSVLILCYVAGKDILASLGICHLK